MAKEDDEFSIDLTKARAFFSKLSVNKKWLTVLLIIIPIIFAIHFRAYSYNLPITDDWAESNIYNSVRSQVSQQINSQYPNLPSANKNQLIDERVNEFLNSQGQNLEQQKQQISQNLKSRFQDDTGQTYLLAIDPYFYYRYAENMLEDGHYGDEIVDGRQYDNHMLAPTGSFTPKHFHPYLEVYFHKFMNLFTNNSLMKNVFFIPILLSALAVIPAFFIARKRVGNFGGFIAAMVIAIHPAFLGRTAGGFADTDPYNVLFPLFIAWFFIETFESNNWKKQIGLGALTGLVMGLYSFAWSGWWYIFDFLLAVVVAYIVYAIIKNFIKNKSWKKIWSNKLKNSLIAFGLLILSSGIFVTLISGFNSFTKFINAPLRFTVIKQAAHANLWPNVYTTVAELNPASISSIINQTGMGTSGLVNSMMFFIAGLGLLFTLIKKDEWKNRDYWWLSGSVILYLLLFFSDTFRTLSPLTYIILFLLPVAINLLFLFKDERDIDIKYSLFLIVWFAGTIYATTKGTRFSLLIVPAFAIAFGISLGIMQSILTSLISKEFKVNKKWISAGMIVLLLLLLINPIKAADRTATGEIPSMNDAWWNSLTKIKNNSTQDAIITSWWDFGHWFKAIADRPVTFDGGTQNRPQAHWVGKLLMSESEAESTGILRMLDCGGNYAFEEVDKRYEDTEISVDVVYDIISMDEASARTYLEDKGFTDNNISEILSYTHCEPPEAFLITSGDMVGKAGVWSHFGSWDFDRSYIYNNVRRAGYQESIDLLTERFNMTDSEAADYYYEVQSLATDQQVNNWIAPWPSYATGSWRPCRNNSGVAECNININIGQSNVAQTVAISGATINLSNPQDTNFILSFIDGSTGMAVGQQTTKPMNLVFAGENLTKYDLGGTDMELDLVYDAVNNRALVSHPALSQSTFTKLFYLDGRYTENFEKFSDMTSVTGSRIIIWKVDWPQ